MKTAVAASGDAVSVSTGSGTVMTVKKGKLTSTGVPTLLSGLAVSTQYVLYYVKEGTTSGLYTEVRSAPFTTKSADDLNPPVYTGSSATGETITLTGGTAFDGDADTRRFYVSKSDLNGLSVTDAASGESSGVAEVWTFTLGAGEIEDVTIGSATPPANKKLEANTRYYVRALDYNSSDTNKKSGLSADLGTSTLEVIAAPTYKVGTPTQTTIPLTKGSALTGDADMRRFYVSKSNLSKLVVDNAVDHAVSGLDEGTDVWTFVLSEDLEEVTIGSGSPKANKKLKANTRYYVRAVDYRSSDDKKSEKSKDLGKTTKAKTTTVKIPPPTYTVGAATQTTLSLTGGSAFGADADMRRFYISKNDLNALSVTNVRDGTSSGVENVWTFALDAGKIETVTIGSGTPPENKGLEAATRYYVRAVDYKASDGRKSEKSDDFGGTTAAKPPEPKFDPVWSTPTSAAYAHPNPTAGTVHVHVTTGSALVFSSDGVEMGLFEVSAGQIDLSDLPAGTYVVRLSEGTVLRVVKQ